MRDAIQLRGSAGEQSCRRPEAERKHLQLVIHVCIHICPRFIAATSNCHQRNFFFFLAYRSLRLLWWSDAIRIPNVAAASQIRATFQAQIWTLIWSWQSDVRTRHSLNS